MTTAGHGAGGRSPGTPADQEPGGHLASYPLTHSQQQIWIGQQLHRDSPLYNMAFAFVLPAGVREDLFRAAWQQVADTSDALRTRIRMDGAGAPRCQIAETGPTIAVLETAFPCLEAFRAWCRVRASTPLDLEGDLVDSVLVRFADGRHGWYLNQHHLVTDAGSTVLLFQRVAAAYEAGLRGGRCNQSDSPGYYTTVGALSVGETTRAAARAHWTARRRASRGVPMYGRPAQPAGTASTRLTLELDERRSRALDERCREAGLASLSDGLSRFACFAMLLTAWLCRITGRHDLGFDAPVGGRSTPAARRALGVFIGMFPFALRVEPAETFRTLAARALTEASLLLRHGLPGESAPSAATASPVVLNYVPASFATFAGERVAVEWVHPGHGDSVHALRLQVHDLAASGRYVLHFDFNDAALDDRLRRRSLRHFQAILDAFLADSDTPIETVDILTADERADLAALNDTGGEPLPARTIVAQIEEQSAREPGQVALREGPVEVTFATLAAQVETIAAALLAGGLKAGDRVAIAGRRSRLGVAAILGVLRARGAFVPIDPGAPPARRDYILDDAGVRFVLVGKGVAPPPAGQGRDVWRIDELLDGRSVLPAREPGPDLSDLAYLMYTSGSTGRPKGVPIDHAGLADYIDWAARRYVRGDRLVYPLCTSLAFDLTITSLFLPLVTGGTLIIYPEPEGPVDSAVLDVVRENAVDLIKLTPSHLSLLRRAGLEGSRIRRMVVGGEDFRTPLAAAVSAALHGEIEIHNEYGPTEAVVGCIAHRYDARRDTAGSVPIGKPADHVRVWILNEAGADVPEGVPGELWVARPGLARGYRGLPELTAERFQPDPEPPGVRRYRTGDLVRLRDPETLEYLGRIDRQVKVSGVRVELGEIEAALLSLPGIEHAAVVLRRRPAHDAPAADVTYCSRCGLPSTYPRVTFDTAGICSICHGYDAIKERAQAYFRTPEDLSALFAASRPAAASGYDCLMLYSGGKDSTYALCRLVEMGLSVYAFTLDNGFISTGAKDNIRRVTAHLGVPIEFGTAPGMAAIFRDSLARFSNVCNGCFKTIYTLGMLRARALGISVVVTGLSRGQLFETRLSGEVFGDDHVDAGAIDAAVLAARKAYHRGDDEVSRAIDTRAFQDDDIFEAVNVVDFYRYCDVEMDEMLAYLRREVPWIRPADTGRSTNCLINDLGIYVHRQERGFHNYALPYSWDVRLGHKTRDAALRELDDDIDPERVRQLLAAIGADESHVHGAGEQASLAAFYVGAEADEASVRRQLADRLPPPLVPATIQRVDAMPLTVNGKVDEAVLLQLGPPSTAARPAFEQPEGPVAEFLAAVWREELGAVSVGAGDNFFELGGTSLTAMQMMVRLCREFDIDLALDTVFTRPRLADLARAAEDRILEDAEPAG